VGVGRVVMAVPMGVIVIVGVGVAAHGNRHTIGLAGTSALALTEIAAVRESLDMVVVAVLRAAARAAVQRVAGGAAVPLAGLAAHRAGARAGGRGRRFGHSPSRCAQERGGGRSAPRAAQLLIAKLNAREHGKEE